MTILGGFTGTESGTKRERQRQKEWENEKKCGIKENDQTEFRVIKLLKKLTLRNFIFFYLVHLVIH